MNLYEIPGGMGCGGYWLQIEKKLRRLINIPNYSHRNAPLHREL